MKAILLFTIGLLLSPLFSLQAQSIDTLTISAIVGSVIDSTEKVHNHLFPYYSSKIFIQAVFIQNTDSTLILRVNLKPDSVDERSMTKEEYDWINSLIQRQHSNSPTKGGGGGRRVNDSAQHYEKFKVGLGVGITSTKGHRVDPGPFIALEPGYHINDNLVVGFRLEYAATRVEIYLATKKIRSYTVNGQYYFSEKKFRPFVGVGLGLFNVGSSYTDEQAKEFGVYPRIGFDSDHFYLTMDYNLMPPLESIYTDENINNYFGFRIGFFVGGGRQESGEKVK